MCNVEPPVYNLGDYQFFEAEFPEVFSVSNLRLPPGHDIVHYIETTGPPTKQPPRRLSPEKLAVLRKELSQLEQLGIIRPGSSPWGSPVYMVKKSNGSWQVVGDYRRLNQVTVKDSYSIPFLHDFTENISDSTIFSSIDLFKSYHQIRIHPEHIAKTAICTPAGNWEFLKMSMGLTNAGHTFQRFMNSLFQDLSFVFVYIDDILIFSSSIEEHRAHLRQVFERLQRNGLIINAAKCSFGQNRLRFLGHIVSDKGIAPVACKVDAINSFSTPQNAQSLRRFLGMVNFYRKFIPQCAKILTPLNSLLQGIPAGRNANLSWNEEASIAFEDIKVALSNATLLNYPQHDSQTALFVDASDKFCGAVLSQIDSSSSHRLLEYFSAAFSDAQKRYSTFDKELLAAYLAIHHFTYFLEGRPFTLYTDHKPLVCAISRKKKLL